MSPGGEQVMKCVVTGAAGFIGSTLTERLLADGHTVIGIDCFTDYYDIEVKRGNIAEASKNSDYTFIEGSLLELDLSSLLSGAHWVFHQAAQAGVRASWGEYFQTYTDNNILATQRLLEASRAHDSIEKIVYASSSSVYGNAETRPTREDLVPQPVSPYGVTKLAAEHLMSLYASEFQVPTSSLRYFTVFGPRQRPDMAFHRFIRAALSGDEITLYGDGEQSRDFTYVDDIVQANILAAERGPAGSVYNVGGGSIVTVNEVLSFLQNEIGELNIKRYDRQAGDARHTSACTDRARDEIGYCPQVSIYDGIRREIAWLRTRLEK